MSGIYVHFPFCRSRCLYCGFYSSVGRADAITKYCEMIAREIDSRAGELKESVTTLYLGGGTPSLVPIADLWSLIRRIRECVGVCDFEEFTIEINPDDVTESNIEGWLECGVTRFSLGVQSLNSDELRRVGRRHSPEGARRAISLLGNAGDLGVDLICGLPGQTMESWLESVEEILSYKPAHISVYMLSLDEGAALTSLYRAGKIMIPDDDASADMYLRFCEMAETDGYIHYEVSNFCRPGHKGIHNSSYWDGSPYLGLGAGAASYDGRSTRRLNNPDLRSYLQGESGCTIEILNNDELREEYLLTRLRRLDIGLDLHHYALRFGEAEMRRLLHKASPYINKGVLSDGRHLRFENSESVLLQDAVIRDLV